ncbi:phage tail tube protein [Microbacterium rhizomatis]|uniref:Phage tail protein n=1 Tax=Microbacterium rhizomatis TaxID=1631477 RepID=A0A5J5J5W4_9MICO|nr:phage tail tube protein [Microbacterium rhizomatis]KAA9110183.1 hypothetical protein F6B43_00285 [Microbacterium rhizomatis]
MTQQLDFSVGMGKETTYGSPSAVTRFFESEAKAKYDVKTIKGSGLRPTKGVARTSRQSISGFEGSTDIELDAPTRGLGFLLNAVMGAVTNTLVSTGLYQQVHTLSTTDPVASYAIQEALPPIGGGASNVHTFRGCVFDSLEISAKEGAYLSVKLSATILKMLTTGATAASYPSDDTLFSFVHGSIQVGGSLTEPGATTLAVGDAIPAVNISDFSLKVARNLDKKGWNLGGAGLRSRPPVLGKPEITGKITAEYTDNVLRDAYLAQTPLVLILTFTSGSNVLQIAMPAIKLKGEVPTSNGGDVITQSIDFEAFDNGTASQPIFIVYRTADTTP